MQASEEAPQNNDTLVVFYSRTGHVKKMAEIIQKETNADIFEVRTTEEDKYSDSYITACFQASKHCLTGFLPKLAGTVDVTKYQKIFIGTPVWCWTVSRPIASFLKNIDLSGKTIIPFISEGGSGHERALNAMKEEALNATFLGEYLFNEKKAPTDLEKDIKDWIEALNKKPENKENEPTKENREVSPSETPENNEQPNQ
ncbi:flavodoxin [Histomonas meleagridis]|uniref:flavodoxin n=1 Tax=Histomonas meleagridis TaxID=135588 RepID=UPI0035598D25|nr:flavodoxin [Histomonas meleagridis]KAH0802722.1 flavodoxin [Histomonas meleagridis]